MVRYCRPSANTSTTLRSMTQGKGLHTQQFERYEDVPGDIMAKIMEDAKREKEAD